MVHQQTVHQEQMNRVSGSTAYQSPTNLVNNVEQQNFYNPQESSPSLSQDNLLPSKNWPPNPLISNQWPKSNSDNILPRQQSLPLNNTWSQSDEPGSSTSWQQILDSANVNNSQWKQPKLQPGGSLEESTLSENQKGEWQQIHALPSHFNSSTTSTTSGSMANMSSSTEQLEDRKVSLTPTASSALLNEFQTQVIILISCFFLTGILLL